MNNPRVLAKIETMIKQYFLIDGMEEMVLQYKLMPNTIKVTTDRYTREFSAEQFHEWAQKCIPLNTTNTERNQETEESMALPATNQQSNPQIVVYQPSFSSANFSDLREILMANIKKVQTEKEYLPQAVAVRDNVQSIIELTKNEIEYVKTLNKISR